MSNVTIECKNISKVFRKGDEVIQVLKDIDLVAHESEITILMGPSGSGKSTLLTIIAGLLKQDSGTCMTLGKEINALSEAEKTAFRGVNIGFMFQHINLIPTVNVIDNVAIPLLLQGFSRPNAVDKAKKLLVSFGLEKDLYSYPNRLSGGEQQRVSIARACVHDPKIILCDEPTSFLDHERGKKIMELLQQIKQDHKATVIIVTHDPRILSYADNIVTLEDGKIVHTASPLGI
jgi:putative ABC transport system ATP-binding protein